jgi:hypothetical protein
MTRWLYSILPRGLPMNPHEVKRGIRLINDRSELSLDCVDAYHLLEEFHQIASHFIPALRDRAMHKILENDGYVKQVSRPFPGNQGLWEDFPIQRNEDSLRPIAGTRLLARVSHPPTHQGCWISTTGLSTSSITDKLVARTLL